MNPIYQFLRENNLTDKDEKSFVTEYSDSAKARQVFDFFQANKLTDKDFNTFYGEYFKKKGGTIPVSETGAAAVSVDQEGRDVLRRTRAAATERIGLAAEQKAAEKRVAAIQKATAQKIDPQIDPVGAAEEELYSKQDRSLERKMIRASLPTVSSTYVRPADVRTQDIINKKIRDEDIRIREEDKALGRLPIQEITKKVKEVKRQVSENPNISTAHLMRVSGIKDPNAIYNLSEEQIKGLQRPGNSTDELAIQAVLDAKKVNEVLKQSGSLEEAAIRWSAKKDPQLQEQINTNIVPGTNRINVDAILSEGSRGAKLFDFLSNPVTQAEIKKNPVLYKQYQEVVPQLLNKYPDFGVAYLGNKISNKMQDLGIDNAIINVVTEKETDKAVDDLVKNGEMNPTEVRFYQENMRGKGGMTDVLRGLVGINYYKTPGFIENLLGGAVKGTMDIGKGAAEFLGLPEVIHGKTELNLRDISDRDLQVNIAPKGITNEIVMSGGSFMGQLAPIALGSEVAALKLGLSPEVASSVLFGLQTYGNNIAEARRMFPDSQIKQRGYATIASSIDALLLPLLGSNKIVKGLLSEMKPEIQSIVNGYASKQISKQAATEGIENAFLRAVSKVPEASRYFAKQVGKNTAIMTALDIAHQVNEGVFEGRPVGDWISGQRIIDNARHAALSSVFLSALGARAEMKNKGVTAKLLYQSASEKPELWEQKIKEVAERNSEPQEETQDKINNFRYASKLYQDLQSKTDMTEKQKIKYFINSLVQNAKLKEAETITDPTLKERAQQEIKNLQEDQKALLDNKDDGTIEGDDSDRIEAENLIAQKKQEAAPKAPLTPELKAKIADIEKRRKDEISAITYPLGSAERVFKLMEIGDKYDAELKALNVGEEVAPEMAQYAMEAPRLAGEPEQISKPIELSLEPAPEVPAAPEKVEPIRQLGTGANVYFENESYRVNDFRDKVLLNVRKAGDAGIVVNLEFNTPEEAVDVAKTLNRLYPKGVPEAVLLDKVVEDIKAGKYKEGVGEEVAPSEPAPEVPPTEKKVVLDNQIPVKRETFTTTDADGNVLVDRVTTYLDGSTRWDRKTETGEWTPSPLDKRLKTVNDFLEVIGKENKIEKTGEETYDKVMNPKMLERLTEDQKNRLQEAAPEVPPTEEELPFGEVAPRKERTKKQETNLKKRALDIEIVDNPRGEVLQYFLSGGKINPKALIEFFGQQKRMGWGKIRVEERRSRLALTDKKAPSIDELAEKIAGTDRLDRVQEYRNAIEQTLLEHTGTSTMAEELVRDYDVDFAEMKRMAELEEMGKDIEEETKSIVSQVPEAQQDEILAILDRFRDEQGFIDWRRMDEEMKEGFDPLLMELSEPSQKIINDAIKQVKETGRVGRISPEALPAKAKAGDVLRRAAEATRAGKISKLGGFRAGTGFDAVWDASLEVIAKALDGGASVADAIEQGLKYVKSTGWYKKLTDKSDFDSKYRSHLKSEYDAIQEPSPEGAISRTAEERGDLGEGGKGVRPSEQRPETAKEGKAEGETAAEKKSVELSLKGINDVANEFSLDPVEGRPRKSDLELREEAKSQIDKWVAEGNYDKNIEELIKKAENLEVLNDKDRVILEQHLANVRQQFTDGINNGTIKSGTEEFNSRLQYIKRLIDASAKTRSAAGAALRVPSGGSVAHPLENYDTALVAKMEANGVDKLTDSQIKEVEESVRQYKEKLNSANERIKDLEDKLSQMMAENEVATTKKKRVIKSKEDRIAERKQAIADAREALRKLRTGESGLSAVPIPFVREFIAISPHVKKVMQSYVEEGIDNLTILIDKIYDDFKGDIPEITKKDIRDIIGNQYTERKQTKSELQSAIRDLTEEARLLSVYEKLLAGEEPASPKKKVERNRKIKELREKINDLRRKNKEADVDYKDLKRIEDTKKRALAQAEEFRKRINAEDFAPNEKPVSIFNDRKLQKKYPKEYAEMLDAVQERDDAKHEFDLALMKDERNKQTKVQKVGRFVKELLGTTRAIKSGIDASATFIQNFAALTAYPSSFLKAFINQWKHFASEKEYNRWHTQLKNNEPVWNLMQKSELSITEPGALKEAQKEEIFSNNLLDRSFKVGGKSYNIGKYLTKPFERLFVSMGNFIRTDVFLKIAEKWYSEGKTFENSPEDFKSLANMLNNITSRAKLAPAIERARDIVGTGIWSPQLMASRLNLLGISDIAMPLFGRKGYYAGLTPEVRKMQIANTAKMIGFGLSIMALASISGADDVDFDPASPTFGTIKIGNKRIPVFSNFTKYVRTIVQFALGKQKVEGEYKDKRRGETVIRFFRSSVPPATGTTWDIITGKDYMSKPVTAEGIVKGLLYPMSIEAIAKDLKRDGALGILSGFVQFFGVNLTDERDYVKKDERAFQVKDPNTFKKRDATEKEMEAFKKTRDEIYKELSNSYEDNNESFYLTKDDKIKLSRGSSISEDEFDTWKEVYYRDLNREQIKELYKLLMSKAKKDAKKELELESVEEEEED